MTDLDSIPKVLIADANPANRAILKKTLNKYKIIEAEDSISALKLVLNESPDLIFLDLFIHGLDGASFLSIIRGFRQTQNIPVLLTLPQEGNSPLMFQNMDTDITGSLRRPYSITEVNAKVDELLAINKERNETEDVQNLIISLVQALEARDAYSKNHSSRVAQFSETLARNLGLPEAECQKIRLAGLFHDIGKIGIADSVLLKPGKLSFDEYEIIKGHPSIGEKICAPIRFFEEIIPYVRGHHERYDGKGYPDGLKGKQIPLGARIIAVADAYDALTSNRSYRIAFPISKVLDILHEGAGIQWDKEFTLAFIKAVENGEMAPAVVVAEETTLKNDITA